MGRTTAIEYADSTANGMMGCAGCELWRDPRPAGKDRPARPEVRTCYAGRLIDGHGHTQGFGGQPGFPVAFGLPKIFSGRLEEALTWSDLRGARRPFKHWLDGLPRVVFLNDMGDAWTPSLALDWMQEWMTRAASSQHVFLLLTKRAGRMVQASRRMGGFPANFLPGVSVTSADTRRRADKLLEVEGGGPRWVSYSPALEWVDFRSVLGPGAVEWLVFEGESGGPDATAARPTWIERSRADAGLAGAAFFVKQVGTHLARRWHLSDSHGRDMSEWPPEHRVREMPIPAQEAPGQIGLLPMRSGSGETAARVL